MPSENEMFYGVIQRGLDKWNAAFFCGSAAVLRREALVTTNGFSGLTITEDCETALELHSRGWNSVYVDKPLIAGLQPETFASFIGQRSRWAQGMMQILRFKIPPFKRGLQLGAAALLPVEHAVLAVPVHPLDLPDLAVLLPVLLARDLRRVRRRVHGLHDRPTWP